VVDRLATADLLEGKFSSEDRRVNQLFLNERGQSLQAPLNGVMNVLDQDVDTDFGSQASTFWMGFRHLCGARD
jgi:DNA-binding MarR family transcriptional regulator